MLGLWQIYRTSHIGLSTSFQLVVNTLYNRFDGDIVTRGNQNLGWDGCDVKIEILVFEGCNVSFVYPSLLGITKQLRITTFPGYSRLDIDNLPESAFHKSSYTYVYIYIYSTNLRIYRNQHSTDLRIAMDMHLEHTLEKTIWKSSQRRCSKYGF